MSDRTFIKVVNQKFDLVMLLRAMGVHIDRIPMTLRCPFHEDNSKSAKLFEDNRLFCWTCHKMYGPWEALQALDVSEGEIKRQLSQMGVILVDPDKEFTVNRETADILKKMYRLGEIPLKKMLDGLYLLIADGERQK